MTARLLLGGAIYLLMGLCVSLSVLLVTRVVDGRAELKHEILVAVVAPFIWPFFIYVLMAAADGSCAGASKSSL